LAFITVGKSFEKKRTSNHIKIENLVTIRKRNLISSNDLPLTKGRYAIIAALSNGAAII
jgi:hypothetical protein